MADEEESALAPPIVCGLVRGGLRGPGVGVAFSLSCELTDWLLRQEKLSEGEAIVASWMVLS